MPSLYAYRIYLREINRGSRHIIDIVGQYIKRYIHDNLNDTRIIKPGLTQYLQIGIINSTVFTGYT